MNIPVGWAIREDKHPRSYTPMTPDTWGLEESQPSEAEPSDEAPVSEPPEVDPWYGDHRSLAQYTAPWQTAAFSRYDTKTPS